MINKIKKMSVLLSITLYIIFAGVAHAVEYECAVEKKMYWEGIYPDAHLKKSQFSVKIRESNKASYVSRCSYVSDEEGVTCDEYKANAVIFDDIAKIKKFYIFRQQFDVQLFYDLTFVENNGRGSVAYGKCKVVSP